jgi:hypothetical protein
MPFHGEAVAAVFASEGSLGKLTGANHRIYIRRHQEKQEEDDHPLSRSNKQYYEYTYQKNIMGNVESPFLAKKRQKYQ